MKLLAFCLLLMLSDLCPAQIKVASLHPLLTDLAQQVGGERVQVVELLKPGEDVHHFEPSAQSIALMKGCVLVFASGMKLESFLDKLRDSLGTVPVVELGRTIPPIKLSERDLQFMDSDDHAVEGGDNPHWWHSADNMARAASVVGDEFIKADPAGKEFYLANASATRARMAALKSWAQHQLFVIPRSERKLVTGHAAFGYFCKEFGFTSLPILGIGRQDEASAQYAAEAVKTIKENHIRAVFPEDQANPKTLQEIVRETGVKKGDDLIADGTSKEAHTFETMLRRNVESIVKALKP